MKLALNLDMKEKKIKHKSMLSKLRQISIKKFKGYQNYFERSKVIVIWVIT